MAKFLLKRFLQLIPTLIILSFVIFYMVRLVPGDPVRIMLGTDVEVTTLEYERERLGLNDPIIVQYGRFVVNFLHGDLGVSIFTKRPVFGELMTKFKSTVVLALASTCISTIVGICFGITAALNRGKWIDSTIAVLSLVAVSTPSFFLAFLLMLLFAMKLHWVPVIAGIGGLTFKSAILPTCALGMQAVGFMSRTTRTAMLDVISQDYIRTSKSRGIPAQIVTFSHALRNALIPIITAVGLRFGGLLAGATVTETVFSINGVGKYLVDGVNNRDFPVVQGTVLFLALVFVVVNTITDIVYAFADPRIKVE